MSKKSKSTTSKIGRLSKIVIWTMLLAMIGSTLISAIYSIISSM